MSKSDNQLSGGWKMFSRNKILVVGGLALLLSGGATYALWSENVNAPATTTTSGHLNLQNINEYKAYDVSGLSPVEINNLSSFKLSPSDKIRIAVPVKAELSGDNLLACLTASASIDFENGMTLRSYGLSETSPNFI